MEIEQIQKITDFIKGKSEKVSKHLWYVSDELLEDLPRFFSEKPNEKSNADYDRFIKNGLNVGFTDDQIDFLEEWILKTPCK